MGGKPTSSSFHWVPASYSLAPQRIHVCPWGGCRQRLLKPSDPVRWAPNRCVALSPNNSRCMRWCPRPPQLPGFLSGVWGWESPIQLKIRLMRKAWWWATGYQWEGGDEEEGWGDWSPQGWTYINLREACSSPSRSCSWLPDLITICHPSHMMYLALVRTYKIQKPDVGVHYICGYLHSVGIHIQKQCVLDSLKCVDHISWFIWRYAVIQRWRYFSSHPNALRHCNRHHKMIKYGFVIHGFINGNCCMVSPSFTCVVEREERTVDY